MKALVIAPQPFFSPRGTPFSVYYRTSVTAKLGVKIDLLTYGEGQDVDIPGARIIRIPNFSFLGNVKVGPSLLKLFLDMLLIVWTVGLLIANRYQFVHAHEEAVFFCRFLKPIFRFKLVYDMHSSLPQQLTNFQFTTSRFLKGLFKKLEDTCLHGSDAVITICPDLAEYAYGLIEDKNKHFLIENSIFDDVKTSPRPGDPPADPSIADSADTSSSLPKDKRFVVYAGTLETYQGIDILIKAFKSVADENPEACLLIVGGTKSQVKAYSEMADRSGIASNCIFTGQVSKTLAVHYCSRAAVLVSPRVTGTNTPLKIYEQLASGIPLVATRIYSHTQVLSNEVAFLVEPEPEGMAGGILSALKSNSLGHRMASNARALYEKKYSREVYENKMQRLLERIAGTPNN